MLVYFHKGFILEGETAYTEKKHFWSKPESVRQKIYLSTFVHGVCDESEVAAEIERLTKEKMVTEEGWGEDFTGWEKVLTFQEGCQCAIENKFSIDRVPTPEPTITHLDNWTVAKAAKELTGKQFAQYCRDYGILYSK